MENHKSNLTIYFEGNIIESNAISILTIGMLHHLKSEKDGFGETMGLLPIDKVVIINNTIKQQYNGK